MRIVIAANNIEELGGAQRVVHQLASGLAHRGHDVTAVGITPHPASHAYPADDSYSRVTILRAPYPKGDRSAAERRATGQLQGLLDSAMPGVIICAQLWAMEHLVRCDLRGWRVIGQYHSSFEAASAGRDLQRAQRVYRDIDAFALLTDADADAFAERGFMNTLSMPNAVARPEQAARLTEPVVTYLGRLSAEKGPRFLIEAWRLLAPVHPAWRMQIIGSGPLHSRIADEVRDPGLRVQLRPPTDDPAGVLRETSILALPSLTEGFPLTLAEAMAAGAACVAADCSSGVRELVADGVTGLLARRGDSAHLAMQLARVMSDAPLRARLGGAARERMAEFAPEVVLDRWESLLAAVQR